MRVSVAMATYNGGPFLRDQLASLTSQTLLPFELVVSDDGSTDGTIAVIAEFARNAPFAVRLLPVHQRLGYADNFLYAARHTSGELVAYCDQDDVWQEQKLERCARQFDREDVVAVTHRMLDVDEQ